VSVISQQRRDKCVKLRISRISNFSDGETLFMGAGTRIRK
jgi:hypothetical protein